MDKFQFNEWQVSASCIAYSWQNMTRSSTNATSDPISCRRNCGVHACFFSMHIAACPKLCWSVFFCLNGLILWSAQQMKHVATSTRNWYFFTYWCFAWTSWLYIRPFFVSGILFGQFFCVPKFIYKSRIINSLSEILNYTEIVVWRLWSNMTLF